MTKKEPDIKVEAVTNNARHGNEIYKPYDKGNAENAASKLCNYLCKGKPQRKMNREPLASCKTLCHDSLQTLQRYHTHSSHKGLFLERIWET